MTDKSRISRRKVLQGAGATTVVGGIGAYTVSGSLSGDRGEGFVVEQGGECVPVEPLSDGDVVDLYGYDPELSAENNQQSNLPAQLESPQKSRLFLYEGPNGLSLVIVHGGGDDEQGGSATFQICGLSSTGEFVVLDDDYEGATDEFDTGRHGGVLNWTWGEKGRNDGAVFRGLDTQFCIDIKALWNDDGKFAPSGSGVVEQWQFLTGSLENPDVVDLALDEPITVRTGSCDSESKCCGINTETVSEPFAAEVSFCCTSVMVDADQYDRVRLNLLDGVSQQFDGSFEGLHGFFAEDDDDQNPNDEIIRTVTIEKRGESVKVENPNFGCCRTLVDEDEGYGDAGY